MDNASAYFIATRQLTNLHHSERTALDASPQLQEILDAVKAGDNYHAVWLLGCVRNLAGDTYRTRRDIDFAN